MKSPAEARRAPKSALLALLALLAALLLPSACHIGQEGEQEQVFSMTALADTLATFDSVRVSLLGPGGDTVDVLYKGKVGSASDLADRPAPHYRGGEAVVAIVGYDDDAVVYRVDRTWDGRSRSLGDIQVHSTARTSVRPQGPARVEMAIGDSLPLPEVTVLPADLSDKRLAWSTSQPGIVAIADGRFKAVSDGEAEIKASLVSDPLRSGSITVVVRPKSTGIPAVSVDLPDDTLVLSVNGGSRRLAATLDPTNADPALEWETPDGAVLRVLPDGSVEGLAPGLGRVVARARLNSSARDTAWVQVKTEVKVTGVAFEKDAVALFVNGAPESLVVRVQPAEADQAVDFSFDSDYVRVQDNKVYGLAKGTTTVTATSRKDPAFKDELRITIAEPEVVKSVRVSRDTATLYAGGDSLKLEATIDPAASNQRVRWSSSRSDLATVDTLGVVRPLKPGLAVITAVSRLDGTKSASCAVTVKEDAPVFSIDGNDTAVAIRSLVTFDGDVTQAHGRIVRFEWKVEGDPAQSGSSDAVKPVAIRFDVAKEVLVTFILVDSEGNRTTVTKKVIVVDGPVLNIRSPVNNSITNRAVVDVVWTVNDTVQTTQLLDTLEPGPNTITRTYVDRNDIRWTRSITVTLDQEAPLPPAVTAASPTRLRNPTWTWATGGRGGHGLFRWRLGNDNLSAQTPGRETAYVHPTPLADGVHTLYVQERDSAGNWSPTGSFAVTVDGTPPPAPTVSSAPLTNLARPTWTWTSNGGGGIRSFRYRFANADLEGSSTSTTDTAYTHASDLADGSYTLYVQERDAVGNWSASGSFPVKVDRTPPGAPVFSANLLSPVATLRPTWVWASGGNGGNGTFRAKVDTANPEGAAPFTGLSLRPAANLEEGVRTLYLQERDSAGNWSPVASKALTLVNRDTLGRRGLSLGGAARFDFAVDGQGTPYLAFSDAGNSSRGSVMKFADGTWNYVGPQSITTAAAIAPSIAIDKDGDPWIAYNDGSQSYRPMIQAYKGGSWKSMGGAMTMETTQLRLALNPQTAVPYVAIQSTHLIEVDSLASSGTWVDLPTPPARLASEGGSSTGSPVSLLFSGSSLYMGYKGHVKGRAIVYRRGATKWDSVMTGLATDSVQSMSLAHAGGALRATLSIRGNVSVYTLSGNTWTLLSPGTPPYSNQPGLATLVPTGSLVLGYPDPLDFAAAQGYWNNEWRTMGLKLSYGKTSWVRVGSHPVTGVVYIAFSEQANGNKLTVMKTGFDPP